MGIGGFASVLKKAFPYISIAASVVPGGNIATTVLGKVLNLAPGATLDDAGLALINATPEQRAALQAEENRHVEAMKSMGINSAQEFEQMAVSDRISARQREMSVRDWMPRIVGSGIVSGFLVATFLVLSGHAKADSVMAGTLIGYLSAKCELVLSYYFGSSSGSDRQTELLAKAQPIVDK